MKRHLPVALGALLLAVVAFGQDPTLTRLLRNKGDLLTHGSGSYDSRLAVGSNDQVLTVDSGQALGLKYSNVSGSSFASQSANLVFAGPSTGAAAAPSFRSLVSADGSGVWLDSVSNTTYGPFGTLEVSSGATVSVLGTLQASGVVNFSSAGSFGLPSSGVTGAGSGSGLDADLLDGVNGAALLYSAPSGCKFAYNSASAVDLVPSGLDGSARVVLYNGSDLKIFTISSTETATISSSGASGLDTGSEASSTFYYVWCIGKSDGTFDLLLSISSTSPTMPSGYTYKRLLWGVANDGSSNIVAFVHLKDGTCYYTGDSGLNSVRGILLLNAGTATSYTAVSMTKAIPDVVGVSAIIHSVPTNGSSTNTQYSMSEDSGGAILIQNPSTVSNTAGNWNSHRYINNIRIVSSAATSYYYKFSVAASSSGYVWCLGWNMGGPQWN